MWLIAPNDSRTKINSSDGHGFKNIGNDSRLRDGSSS